MNKAILAFVFAAMVWLVPSMAFAASAFWKCTASITINYNDDTSVTNGRSREFKADSQGAAEGIARAFWSKTSKVISSVIVHYIRCTKPAMSDKKAKTERKPFVPPPIPPAKAAKPMDRVWTCRVKLTWHVNARSGKVDETWSDIEAPSEAAAMSIAIQRSQGRLKALTLAGTNPTWGKTDATCT